MFVLKNAWGQLMRHKLRTLLILVIALVVAFGSLFTLSVRQANETATVTDRASLAPGAIVRMTAAKQAKYDGTDSSWVKNYLTTDTYNGYYAVVTTANITLSTVNASESFPVRQTSDSIQAIAGTSDASADKTGGEFTLKSFTSVATARDNDLGSYKVVKGKHLSYSGKAEKGALISQALASKNNLKVGDKFTIASPSDAKKTTELVVRGIYEYTDEAAAGHGSDAKLAKDNRDNAIYVAYSTMYTTEWANEKASDWSKPDLSYVFEFSSMSDYNKFVKNVKKTLKSGYEVSSPTITAYEQKIKPITALNERMNTVSVAVLAAGGVLLLALVLLSVWRRGDEIGTALICGVTGGRMGWQLMLEAFIPLLVGLGLGLLVGGFASKPLGASLATGYATTINGGMIWHVGWIGLVSVLALGIVAALRVACFGPRKLFAARAGFVAGARDNAAEEATA
ncbi:ABC transporter permease [Bifidobacterium amazonense]|uniref:ABC transporter permease n=1 Tax=Bifidobacterium amazonense TaxID=2809027 RepID=A0ABS9VU35_9BIFI|nr:FtsX-like permease family protein [Bifidobacterium amazonense]MCH9275449.1 ABC transporter permease [Bifidobacterium amazonense]